MDSRHKSRTFKHEKGSINMSRGMGIKEQFQRQQRSKLKDPFAVSDYDSYYISSIQYPATYSNADFMETPNRHSSPSRRSPTFQSERNIDERRYDTIYKSVFVPDTIGSDVSDSVEIPHRSLETVIPPNVPTPEISKVQKATESVVNKTNKSTVSNQKGKDKQTKFQRSKPKNKVNAVKGSEESEEKIKIKKSKLQKRKSVSFADRPVWH